MVKRVLFVLPSRLTVEPLGVMYLISELKICGYDVELCKSNSLSSVLSSFRPDVVCLSMTTGQHVELLQVAKWVKDFNSGIKIIIGGPHVTYFPKVGENEYVDYFIRGEADFALPRLLKNLNNGQMIMNRDNSFVSLPDNLDELPNPDRTLVYNRCLEFLKNRMKNVLTSRGCYFNCHYCYNSVYRNLYKGQRIVRYRSPKSIVDECVYLKSTYPTEMIFFADDEFSMDKVRLEDIKNLYIDKVQLPFHCQLRIDVLDEDRVKMLKEMGCYSLTFAIEIGDEDLRRTLLNRNVKDGQILKGCSLLKKYGIKFRAQNMIALPDETNEQLVKTIKLNQKVNPDYAWVSLYQPYPGTVLGDWCISHGLFDEMDVDKIKVRFTEDTVLNMSEDRRLFYIKVQRLFALIVRFPFLFFLLPMFMRFGSIGFYTKLREFWKRRCYKRLFKGI